jgi:hypothetical protein
MNVGPQLKAAILLHRLVEVIMPLVHLGRANRFDDRFRQVFDCVLALGSRDQPIASRA